MEATHRHEEHQHSGHSHGQRHDHDDQSWQSREFVDEWLQRQETRAPERRRQYVVVRAMIPKAPDDAFTYVNLGAGAGNLDELLLAHFGKARAVLVDGSQAMLDSARERLEPFAGRVDFVVADLSTSDWLSTVTAPFDVVVTSFAAHHAGAAERVRELYAEAYDLLADGGTFVNLEYVRTGRPDIVALSAWAANDSEAQLSASTPRHSLPGTMVEQLGWLTEAGFVSVDATWKHLNVVCFCAIKGALHLPEAPQTH